MENLIKKHFIMIRVKKSLHTEIKIAAAKRNMTITKYVLQAIGWRMDQEKKN